MRTSPAQPRAFTLVEVIVAIGVLAVVGVIVGTIFATVGDTVAQGQRVSTMNRFASRIERVMRRDFESMVRESGFLVIRNEITSDYAAGTPQQRPVALTVTDSAEPRARRIDELMFFSRGDFTSKRTPLHRDMIARANVARVYYGHGQRMPENFGDNPDSPVYTTRYARPRLDEPNNFETARLGEPSGLGVVNPNEFASDWTLLRHATLLVPRAQGTQNLPDEVFGLRPNDTGAAGLDAFNRIADSSRQVALGPAAQSVFRAVAHMAPYELGNRPDSPAVLLVNPSRHTIRNADDGAAALVGGGSIDDPLGRTGVDESLARPLFTSGLVDVAVTDLDEIRATVTGTWIRPFPASPVAVELSPPGLMDYDFSSATERLGYEQGRARTDSNGIQFVGTALLTGAFRPNAQPQTQQLWMLDALPSVALDPSDASSARYSGFRVRYEPAPPRAAIDDGALLTDSAADREVRLFRAIEQADQEVLGAHAFLPRCTEFIVEWSFGIVDRRDPGTNPNYGRPIWHGLRRYADGNDNGRYDEGGSAASSADTLFADLFGLTYDGAPLEDRDDQTDDDFGIRGVIGDWFLEDGSAPQNGGAALQRIDREMVELVRVDRRYPPTGDPEDAVAAEYCFGYAYTDTNNTPLDASDDETKPWPWPRLIRVTMRFVDPSDPETERTYQTEFRVPTLAGEM
jgi:prepilin-type N-terminal cleavage/methylation domain-containing protein